MEKKYFETLATGWVIYYYDFVSKQNGQPLKFGKLMVDIFGHTEYINSSLLTEDMLGKKVQVIVGYDGKDWKVLSLK